MSHVLPEDAVIITAGQLNVGDSIYVPENWFDNPASEGERFRKIVEIRPDSDGDLELLCIVPETLPGEPGPLVQWVNRTTLVVVPK